MPIYSPVLDFRGLFKHFLAEKWKIILGKRIPTTISSRQGIARDSGMKTHTNDLSKKETKKTNPNPVDCQQSLRS